MKKRKPQKVAKKRSRDEVDQLCMDAHASVLAGETIQHACAAVGVSPTNYQSRKRNGFFEAEPGTAGPVLNADKYIAELERQVQTLKLVIGTLVKAII